MDTATPYTTNSQTTDQPLVVDAPQEPKRGFRISRSRSDRMLGGVCGGLAAELDVAPALLRIGFVVLTVLSFGTGVLLYGVAWALAPES